MIIWSILKNAVLVLSNIGKDFFMTIAFNMETSWEKNGFSEYVLQKQQLIENRFSPEYEVKYGGICLNLVEQPTTI